MGFTGLFLVFQSKKQSIRTKIPTNTFLCLGNFNSFYRLRLLSFLLLHRLDQILKKMLLFQVIEAFPLKFLNYGLLTVELTLIFAVLKVYIMKLRTEERTIILCGRFLRKKTNIFDWSGRLLRLACEIVELLIRKVLLGLMLLLS